MREKCPFRIQPRSKLNKGTDLAKIIYHHRTLGDGAEGIHIREMVNAFRSIGHTVVVTGPTGEPDGASNKKKTTGSRFKNMLPQIFFEMLELGYSFYCFILLCFKIRKIKPDFIYDRYITFNAGAIWAGRLCGIPVVLEVNAPLAFERSTESDERLFFKKWAFKLERYICSHADMTIVVSTPLKDYLESAGVPAGKCHVMPNGVNQRTFSPKIKNQSIIKTLGIPNDATIIGFAGILRPWHGLELVIEAVAGLKSSGRNVYLLIVGDGPIRQQIEKTLMEVDLSKHFCITGRIRHDMVADYVNIFDIAVSPKATFYASPMKIVEYMALGKAVVAPDSQNFRDMIDNEENGILFSNDTGKTLTEALELLCDSSSLRRQLGNKARSKVENRLNWEWNANEVYRQINARQWERN